MSKVVVESVRRCLWPSPYARRFQKELTDHIEDAGSEKTIGDPRILAAYFNRKTGARKKFLMTLIIFFMVLWCTQWCWWALQFDETPMESQLASGFGLLLGPFIVVGYTLILPILYIFVIVNPLMETTGMYGVTQPIWGSSAPLLTAMFYTILYLLFAYKPWRFITRRGTVSRLAGEHMGPPRQPITNPLTPITHHPTMQFSKELLKGTAELIVLQALKSHGSQYGYQLIQTIAQGSNNIFELQEGTLYPLLYRLEDKGFVTSEEKEAPSGKTRRYYTITQKGSKLLAERKEEVTVFVRGMKQALNLAV